MLGGYVAGGGGTSRQMNHPTTARIPDGALVERGVPFDLKQLHTVMVDLNQPDFHTAEQMAASINASIGSGRARAIDSRRIEVVPAPTEDMVALLDKVESVEVSTFPRARVVVNERTGTIVAGSEVRLQEVAVTHGNLTVRVEPNNSVSQPGALSAGTTAVVSNPRISAQEDKGQMRVIPQNANVGELVQALNAMGASPRDLIAILEAIQRAGALQAELVVM